MIANKIRDRIKSYKSFRSTIKSLKSNNFITKSNKYYLTTQQDILNWKSFYLYDREMFSDDFDWEEWGAEIEQNRYATSPSIYFLTNFVIVKEKIKEKNKICLIDKDFANNFCSSNLIDINCYFGFNKYVIEFDNGVDGWGLICKIGEKNLTKFIIIENIKFPLYHLIECIMKEKYDILSSNKFKYGNLKLKTLIIDMDNEKEEDLVKNNNDNENSSFDLVIKIMILLYGLNKEIKNKMKKKLKKPEKYFLINSEWIRQFKNNYNYSIIYNYLLQKNKYYTYSQYESNINLILENFKQSNIINENEFALKDMKDISFIPFQSKLKNNFMQHYIKFNIITSKINYLIKKLLTLQNINYYNNHAYYFYIGNKTILKADNFFEIGYFDFQEVFISKYYFLFDKNKNEYIDKEINKLIKIKDINKYFALRNIEMQTKEIQDLIISNEKVGSVFNLKINNIIGMKNNSNDKKDIKKNSKNKKYNSGKKRVIIEVQTNINKKKYFDLMKYIMKLK